MNKKMKTVSRSFQATFSELEKELMPELSASFEATFSELEKELMPESLEPVKASKREKRD